MHRNSRKLPLILSVFLVFTLIPAASAQKSTSKSQGVAPVIFLDSTKEQDGLIGPVRRIQTETAKLDTKSGTVTEGPRQLLEITTYNLKGERVDNASYPIGGPSGTEEYKYDDKGNIVEMTLRGANGSILSREVYAYETDGVGNWIKMTTSLVLFEDGKLRYEPVEATYRTIAYFYDETIAKLLDAHSASSNARSAAPSNVVQPKSTEPKNPAAGNARPLPSAQPPVNLKRLEEERRSGSAEGAKVESPANSLNRRANPEVPVGGTARAANVSRPVTEPITKETAAKETTPVPNSHKAAFEFYKTGREQFGLGNLMAAIESYKRAIEIEPKFADVHLSLGHAYLRLQKNQDAIKAFKEATRLNPDMEEAHYGLGLEYFRTSNMKDAAQAFKKAVRVRPNMAKAHYGLALAYQEMGKQDLLLEEYRILQTLDTQLAKKLADTFPEFNLPCGGRRCD